jgi:hypothetical protein
LTHVAVFAVLSARLHMTVAVNCRTELSAVVTDMANVTVIERDH